MKAKFTPTGNILLELSADHPRYAAIAAALPDTYAKDPGNPSALTVSELLEIIRRKGPAVGRDLINALAILLRMQPQLRRDLSTRDLSYLQTLSSLHYERDADPDRYDNLYHGPFAPGPGWTFAGTGPQGGKRWAHTSHVPRPKNPGEPTHEHLEGPSGQGAGRRLPAGEPGADVKPPHEGELPRVGEGVGKGGGLPGLPGDKGGGIAGNGVPAARPGDGPTHGKGTGDGRPAADAPRITLDGDVHYKAGDKWINEAKPQYQVSDSRMQRFRESGRVKDVPTPENPTDAAAGNFHYESRDFFEKGKKHKFIANLAAIKTLRAIQAEGRTAATPEEQELMSRYVGWGQMPELFNWRDHDWDKEREQFKSFTDQGEWEAARKSTINAHYTDPSIVDAHWKMAQRLGFKGGRFLETSAGIGYYMGMMPAALAGTTKTSAVELDSLTGQMLKLLYPKNNVEVKGFQEHQAPDNFYDLVASNVPFAAEGVHDPRYNKHQAALHDYFFLKSADIVRPGGLMMHITSTGTLDKPASKIREELAKNFDLVSAIRFPGQAHKEGAGTDVVTDMVILRKRQEGEKPVDETTPEEAQAKGQGFTGMTTDSLGRIYHWKDGKRVPGPNWTETTTIPDPAGGEPIPVNKYFADHPEQILGTLDRTGTMYREGSTNVSKTEDYEQRLQAAIDNLPEGLMKPQKQSKEAFVPDKLPAPGDVLDGGYSIQGGKLYMREGGALIEQPAMSPEKLALLQAHMDLRDTMRTTLNTQIKGESAEAARAELNKAYDAFIEKHGPLNSPANKKAFADDPDAPNLLALEKWDAKTKTATKADIFTKDTIRSVAPVTRANDAGEALGVSLHETGHIDLARMAKLTGQSEEVLAKELAAKDLAFNDPGEGWKPADQYLSGNVRRKLVLARAAMANDPAFKRNVDALEKVQPEDIDHTEINVRLGAPWVPPSDVAEFAASLLGGRPSHFEISYVPAAGWQAHYSNEGVRRLSGGQLATEVWSAGGKKFTDILQAALNGTPLTCKTEDAEGNSIVDKQATDDANQKVQEVKDAFNTEGGDGWLWEDDARRERLHRHYNDNFNNVVGLHYNGQHQVFPGMNPAVNIHPHIKDFVWQVVTTGKGLAAHEVGTGKTYTMIATAMELRRLGLARKPAIACLKANIEAITDDARTLYPGAKILSTADMFDAAKRKQTMSRIATGDYDLIIMTHDNLNMMQMKPETQAKYIREELAELEAAVLASKADNPKKDNRVVKALEKQKMALEAKLGKALDPTNKDKQIFFEESGIDHLMVDEAHKYKSLPCYTKQGNLKGVPKNRSNRATSMLMRTRWLMEQNGGRGVVFATGTPVANTMAELYNMQRYLQPDQLKERGIESFDAWANVFGEVESKHEFSVAGEYKPVSRFSKFVNLPELTSMTGQVIDVQRADDLKRPDGSNVIVRPNRHDKIVLSPENEEMTKLMKSLQDRAKSIKGPAKKGEDNMLVICTDGRKGAIDMRLLDANNPDSPDSKTNQAVRKILELHHANPGKAQLLFSDVGVHPSKKKGADKPESEDSEAQINEQGETINAELEAAAAGDTRFHLYGDIIDKLVKGGIPREKIADFSTLEGAKKEAAQEAMRNGQMVVGIGSTDKMGTGVNVQKQLIAMHHLDVPWVPANIEQRDGRGWRHGNMNKDIDVYRYVAEGSLDKTFWQIVGKKASFIRQVMKSSGTVMPRTAKEEDSEVLTPEQLMAAASGDPRVMEKVNVDEEVKSLNAAHNRHHREQARFKNAVKKGETEITSLKHRAEQLRGAVKHLGEQPKDFEIDIGGTKFTDRNEAAKEWEKVSLENSTNAALGRDWEPGKLASFRGMDVMKHGGRVYLQAPDGTQITTGDKVGSVEYVARNLGKEATQAEQAHEKAAQDLEKVKSGIGKAFPKTEALAAARQRQQELTRELSGKMDKANLEKLLEAYGDEEDGHKTDGVFRELIKEQHMNSEDIKVLRDLFFATVAKPAPETLAHYRRRGAPLRYARADWSPYTGPKGGRGWRNNKTGYIFYGDQAPGDGEDGAHPDDPHAEKKHLAEQAAPVPDFQHPQGPFAKHMPEIGTPDPKKPGVLVPHAHLNIDRAQMPQIPGQAIPEFLQEMMSSGIGFKKEKMEAKDLKATQNEIGVPQITGMAEKVPLDKLQGMVIVSSDNHLLDGHHRWGALILKNPNLQMDVIKVDLPIRDLLKKANGFKDVLHKTVGENAPAGPGQYKQYTGHVSKNFSKEMVKDMEMPSKLPEDAESYFDVPEGAVNIPVDKIRALRARTDGIENAGKYMWAARKGLLPKRGPINLIPHEDGTFSVSDGNSTFAQALKNGWKNIPANLVDESDIGKHEHGPKVDKNPLPQFFKPEELALPKVAHNDVAPNAGYAVVAQKAHEANHYLQQLLNMGKGIGHQLGYDTMAPKSQQEFEQGVKERCEKPGGFVLLAPIKGEKRATEKVNSADMGGDWSKITDMARASIVVDTPEEAQAVLDKMRAAGVQFAKAPKDRLNKPSEVGYGDLMTVIKTPGGMACEVQVHLKPMYYAKEFGGGHHWYEPLRELDEKYGKYGHKIMTQGDFDRYKEAFEESVKVYDAARAQVEEARKARAAKPTSPPPPAG